MTTAPRTPPTGSPGPGTATIRPALVLTALLAVAAAGLGLLTTGASAALGALVGAAMVAVFFAPGAVVLDLVARLAPGLSLLVAMLTYLLKVVLLAMLFVGLQRSGLLVDDLDPRWLGGTTIAATFGWLGAQVRAALRARIPVYDAPVPTPSERREAGAS